MLRTSDPESIRFPAAKQGLAVAVPGLLLVLTTVLVCWPGVHGFWGRDDFPQLAMVRLLDSPWALFWQDHYVVPGSVFRPLGFASMWLGAHWFGHDYAAHAMLGIGLHVLTALVLFAVLCTARVPRVVAMLCALLFALHPAVTGTVMWWSARFDVLSTLFIVLSLLLAQSHCHQAHRLKLLLAAVAMLAAMLSKEIGLVAVAAAIVMFAHKAWLDPGWRRFVWPACGVAILSALVFLSWRWIVLGTAGSHLTGSLPMVQAIFRGLAVWLQQAPGYLSFWSRLDILQKLILLAAGLGLLVVLAVQWRSQLYSRALELVLPGLCLLLLPALLQAPVMAMNALPLNADFSAVQAAMQARLYYLGMVGVAMLMAAAFSGLWRFQRVWPRVAGSCIMLVAVVVFAVQAHHEARGFAQRSRAIADVARAASKAVTELDLPPAPCHVALVGVEPPAEWGAYVFLDSIVKALAPDPARLGHCWFHSNYPTGFYLLQAPVSLVDAQPYQPRYRNGRRLPWRHVGNAVIALLDPASDIDPHNAQRILRYDGHAFEPLGPESKTLR